MKYELKYYWVLPILCMVLTSCIPHSEQTSSSKQNSSMALRPVFELPKNVLKYTGSYHQEGDGPLGPMNIDGNINMIIEPTNKWPMSSSLTLHLTHAKVVDYKGDWHKADKDDLPPPKTLPEFFFDKYGRSECSYDIGKMPLSMFDDLWPLPGIPIKTGDSHEEKIVSQNQSLVYQ